MRMPLRNGPGVDLGHSRSISVFFALGTRQIVDWLSSITVQEKTVVTVVQSLYCDLPLDLE